MRRPGWLSCARGRGAVLRGMRASARAVFAAGTSEIEKKKAGNVLTNIIIEVVEDVLAEYGFKLIIVNTKEDSSRELENIHLLSSGIVDGVIVASTLVDFREIQAVIPSDFPIVLIDRTLENANCDSVMFQDFSAIYDGVCRMIEQGNKKMVL